MCHTCCTFWLTVLRPDLQTRSYKTFFTHTHTRLTTQNLVEKFNFRGYTMDMDKYTYSSLYARLTYIQVSGKLRNDTINDIHCLQTDLHVAAVDVSRLCSKRQQYPAGQLITNSSTRTCAPRTWRGAIGHLPHGHGAGSANGARACGWLAEYGHDMNMLLLCSTNNCEQTKF